MDRFPTKLFQKGQYIVIKDSKVQFQQFYLIQEGEVEVELLNKKFFLKKGGFINLISALTNKKSILTVRAISDVRVTTLYLSNILQYQSIDKNIILNISRELNFHFGELYSHGSHLVLKQTKKDVKELFFELGLYLNHQKLFRRSYYTFNKFLEHYPNDDLSKKVEKYMLQIGGFLVKSRKKIDKYSIYTKGEVIYTQFEKADRIYFLKKGTVKFFYFSGEKEYYIEILKNKTIFGNMVAGSSLRNFSAIVSSKEAHILSFTMEKFKDFMINQKSEVLLSIIQNLAERILKAYIRVEHMLKFHNKSIDFSVQIYDILYSFYETRTETNEGESFFNFYIKAEDLLNSTNLPKDFKLENLVYLINKTSFLSFDNDENIICKDILALKASCYKAR